jgi:hypothetical protein
MPNPQYPGLSPQFQGEVDDYSLANEMTRKALDPRFRSLQRQSPTQSTFMSNYEDDMRAQDMLNKVNAGERQRYRQAAEKDMDWRMRQQDSDMRRSIMQQELEMRRQQMADSKEQRTYERTQAEKNAQTAMIREMMRSDDPAVQMAALAEMQRMTGGGTGAAAGGSPSPSGGSNAYIKAIQDSITRKQGKEDQAEKERLADKERRLRQEDLDREQLKFDNRQRILRDTYNAALAGTEDPEERSRILNNLSSSAVAGGPSAYQTPGLWGGLTDTMNDVGAQGMARQFKADPMAIERYKAKQSSAKYDLEQAPIQRIQNDPQLQNSVAELSDELSLAARKGMFARGLDPTAATALQQRIESVIQQHAGRIPGATPEAVKQVISISLRTQARGLDEQALKQIMQILNPTGAVAQPPPSDGRIAGPFAGADTTAFPAF